MGREVRMVPADWEHPKDYRGRYIPLLGGSYSEAAARWDTEYRQWINGLVDDFSGGWKPYDGSCEYYWEYAGPPPRRDEYMPDWASEERTHYMMYEDTSEGTPISPAFASPEELARWLTDNEASAFGGETATYDAWLSTIKRGWAISGVVGPDGIKSGVEGLHETEST